MERASHHLFPSSSTPPNTKIIFSPSSCLSLPSHMHQSHFTQGLSISDDGKYLFESVGIYGKSKIIKFEIHRKGRRGTQFPLDFEENISLQITKEKSFPKHIFLEGLQVVKDKIFVLTWRENILFLLDFELNILKQMEIPSNTEGWGITKYPKGENININTLIQSDGTNKIYAMDIVNHSNGDEEEEEISPSNENSLSLSSFSSSSSSSLSSSLSVVNSFQMSLVSSSSPSSSPSRVSLPVPIDKLNEMETIDGIVWANRWMTNQIVGFTMGKEKGNSLQVDISFSVDISNLTKWDSAYRAASSSSSFSNDLNAVANGIAHHEYEDGGRLTILTGKLWNCFFTGSFIVETKKEKENQ